MGKLDLDDYRFDGTARFDIGRARTSEHVAQSRREEVARATQANLEELASLQDRLYADGREGLIILFQAMDAAGKDSTIKRVMGAFNPQGVAVHSFKQPSREELAHDYLWRAARALPERGRIAIFNRSYYEDVLVARVHGLERGYAMPERVLGDGADRFYGRRYRQIRDFEEHLYEEGYRVVKVFLNVSREEQRERFLERIDNPSKNWKFSSSDVSERALWDDYMDAYERAIDETATRHAPWYVVPMDQKWHGRYIVSEIVLSVLRDMDPRYPDLPDGQKAELVRCREILAGE